MSHRLLAKASPPSSAASTPSSTFPTTLTRALFSQKTRSKQSFPTFQPRNLPPVQKLGIGSKLGHYSEIQRSTLSPCYGFVTP
jgi:hypothetical protein